MRHIADYFLKIPLTIRDPCTHQGLSKHNYGMVRRYLEGYWGPKFVTNRNLRDHHENSINPPPPPPFDILGNSEQW